MLSDPTSYRLRQLPLLDTVWEGARVPVKADWDPLLRRSGRHHPQNYVVWIDGISGAVRAIEALDPNPAQPPYDAIVHALLRAMETTWDLNRNPVSAGRPRKIVVRDRELHFFLRGILQNLEIKVEYQPFLPVTDQLMMTLTRLVQRHPPALSLPEQHWLQAQTQNLWATAPWQWLADHQILEVQFPDLQHNPLHVSVLGKLALEFGLLFYRSQASLQEFRQQMLNPQLDSPSAEEAFLRQDCFYLTYLSPPSADTPVPAVLPVEVGSIHPLDGIQPRLSGEQLRIVVVAIEALTRFFQQYQSQLEAFPALSQDYRIDLPSNVAPVDFAPCHVRVTTCPQLSQQLQQAPTLLPMTLPGPPGLWSSPHQVLDRLQVQQTLIPDRAMVSVGQLPWTVYSSLVERQIVRSIWPWNETTGNGADGLQADMGTVQGTGIQGEQQRHGKQLEEEKNRYRVFQEDCRGSVQSGEGLPIILVQSTQSQAKALIGAIEAAGGLEAIGFNPGHDPVSHMVVDLGLLKLRNGVFEVFGEYNSEGQGHRLARQKWDQRTHNNGGRCGLLLATGVNGPSQGKPSLQDLVQLWEVPAWSPEQLGLGMLRLQPVPSLSR
ncbi:MAG: DUF6930 domain-containing protein [Prochlorothrix sp.]